MKYYKITGKENQEDVFDIVTLQDKFRKVCPYSGFNKTDNIVEVGVDDATQELKFILLAEAQGLTYEASS